MNGDKILKIKHHSKCRRHKKVILYKHIREENGNYFILLCFYIVMTFIHFNG